EQLILLTFTDTTEIIKKRKSDNKRLEAVISYRTTALEESYKILREKNIFLEKMNRELETFTFISSHDLQEPLRKIKLFTSCLLDEENAKLSSTGKGYLKKVQHTVGRMQMLIDDLLIYAGVKEGKHNFEKTDLNKVIKEVIGEFKESIKEKKAIITANGTCHTKVIVFQFRQVIQNLISNALKFSHPKRFPRITIKCAITPGRLLHYNDLMPEVNYCHICVVDNGIGFEPEYRDRIFEVFQRLHGQSQYNGTGIGLAICKRIVENHKGIVIATGKPNKGSQFDIYIPTL
ncbi:MAG TPA: ATP-binding protein, partial [Cytophagaceae bacterium]|nr:ATP-binding protein [Cytophagaceae bacterium]